jgi:hypothetical protein
MTAAAAGERARPVPRVLLHAFWKIHRAMFRVSAAEWDGPRAVRAREAGGPERERLWLGLRDYPGWGDIEALRGRRSRPTALVVLEPID